MQSEENLIEDEEFININFEDKILPLGNYDNCTFKNCNFANTDLSNYVFSECIFDGCNLSMATLVQTAFRDVVFKDCKLLGLKFEDCDKFLFTASFENCVLNLSSFYKMKMKKTLFKNCAMQEVDFVEADLTAALFEACDLMRCIFEKTILAKADLRTSFNYTINPEINDISQAKFSLTGLPGLLTAYNIKVEE